MLNTLVPYVIVVKFRRLSANGEKGRVSESLGY